MKYEALYRHLFDLIMKKFGTACYTIRMIKTNMSASALKIIYHAFLHAAMSYGIMFWGNSSHSSTIFSMQKGGGGIRIMEGCGNRILYINLFRKLKVLPLTSNFYYLY